MGGNICKVIIVGNICKYYYPQNTETPKTQNQTPALKKLAKYLAIYFSEEDTQIDSKHKKRCLMSLITTEMIMKTKIPLEML